ncbi:electron transfer flavoprotein subunit beta/FixA family protein [Chakrabartyella piscis]|uniref:electron transfer flavoprotein subunit beta/FixA family protein n=1 Tax=Chakrabartyella piscis TaxID=2918914 RepID=UPI0029588D32|nr:electron transfer flavoprotein subunit beta/FixA family protein [Chakrabartyella piscis]
MKIIVCIKQVPDTVEVKIDPKTGTLIRDGVPSIINYDDKTGIEAALQLKEQLGGTVTVVSMGPPQAEVALREALAMGCDDAYLVSAREFGGSDTYATSGILAGAVKTIGYDMIITGRQAIDGDTAQVGPQLAEKLSIPQVSYVEEVFEATEEYVVVKRQFESGYHKVKIQTPCLLTAIAELAEPRYMSVRGIVEAYEKEIKTIGFEDIKDGLELDMIGLKGSPTNVYQSFTKELKGAGTVLKDLSVEEAVAAIIQKMEDKFII